MQTAQRVFGSLLTDALDSYGPLAEPTPASDPALQELVEYAAEVCGTPISLVSVVEADRQRFLAELGFGRSSTSREESFCAHAMLQDGVFTVTDARADARFENNPLVVGPSAIRFYSGVPIKDRDGIPVGSFCVIDTRPRELTPFQIRTLVLLARQAEARLEALRSLRVLQDERVARARAAAERERMILDLELERMRFRALLDGSPAFSALLCGEDLVYEYTNEAHAEILGGRDVLGKPLCKALPELAGQGVVEMLEGVFRTGEPRRVSQMPLILNGRTRYVDAVYEPYREPDGTISGVFAQGVDVTDCVLAQRELERLQN